MALKFGTVLGIVAAYLLLSGPRSSSSANSPTPATPGTQFQPVQTGGSDAGAWARARIEAARFRLERLGIAAAEAAEVARSLVAQWAHETAVGKKEFNFNLGGWIAAKGRPFHVLSDATTGKPLRWESFRDLTSSVAEHIDRLRLRDRYRRAFALLLQAPASDDWIRELGRSGYYEAPQDVYARAWAAHRRALEPLGPRIA